MDSGPGACSQIAKGQMRRTPNRLDLNLDVTCTTAWRAGGLLDKQGTSTSKAILHEFTRQSFDGGKHRTMDGSHSTLFAEKRR